MTRTKQPRHRSAQNQSDQSQGSSRRASEILAAVRPIAERTAAAHALELWDISFVRVAGRDTLRVAADRVGAVTSGELAQMADDLSRELDHSDTVPGSASYVLEVTSPGAERRVSTPDQFRVCRGRLAVISLRDGTQLEGVIEDAGATAVSIETSARTQEIAYENINSAELRVPRVGN